MTNAWMIKPLSAAAINVSVGSALGAPSNMLNDFAGVVWRSVSGTGASIVVDLGADTAFDTIMLFGVSLAPSNAALTVDIATAAQGSFGGAFWAGGGQSLYAGASMPVNGQGVAIWQAPTISAPPASARYVRINVGAGGAALALQVSRIVIGKRVQLERNYSFGGAFGVRDLGSIDFSRRGVLLRTDGKRLRTIGLTFSNIHKDEVEATVKPLIEYLGNTKTFALVTDPDPHAERQNRCYFGPLVGDLSLVQRNARSWESKVNVVSVF